MSASIYIHWPGCSSEQQAGHPGFDQDDHPYATWVTALQKSARAQAVLRTMGVDALLCVGLLGDRESKMSYTTPSQLKFAALSLCSALQTGDTNAVELLGLYVHGPGELSPTEELTCDLTNVAAIADHAATQGARQITLLVGW